MSNEILNAIYEIADHVFRGDTVDETLASTVKVTTALVNCDECFTYVRQQTELVPWVWKHVPHISNDRAAIPLDRDFVAALSFHRAPVALSSKASRAHDFRIFEEWSSNPGETFVCVPFLSHHELLGAITIHHRRPRPYHRPELKLLSSIGYLLGADLRITRLAKENSELELELETRKLVERSKGILQRELGISEQEAYLALQGQSRRKDRPIKEIAQAIILGAQVRQSVVQSE